MQNEGIPLLSSKQEYTYSKLKEMIISNELRPGVLLVERNLGKILNVSRTPIRTALTQLVNEGLVLFAPGQGMAVAPIYSKDIQETYTLREVLDVLAIKLFMENATKAMKLDIEDTVEAMEKAYAEHDYEGVAKADKDFHHIYSSNTGNKRLETMLGTLRDQANRMLFYAKMDDLRIQCSIKEHREIMEAVKDHDVTKAQDAMYHHMLGLKEYHLKNTQTSVIGY